MIHRVICGGLVFGMLFVAGCASTAAKPQTEARDPEGYLKPENSRVPFKLTNSYSFPDTNGKQALVDDIDARDDAVDNAGKTENK